MTGRAPLREGNQMYGGTSVNRNYQSTGRTLSNREGNLELYAHRKNQSKNELSYPNGDKNERRGWKKEPNDKGGLQRYNSIEMKRENYLENSLPPKEKNKRGLSILNRENNNFVRDVSERVKREPLTRLKSIGLYQEKDNEYQFSEEFLQKAEQTRKKSKSGILKEEPRQSGQSGQTDTFKSIRVLNKSLKQEKAHEDKRTSIDQQAVGEVKKKKLKSETLKHLKRRNPRKKKRDLSTRKKTDKDPKKREKGKKKTHQPSLSIKLERNADQTRTKRANADAPEKKNKKKKKNKGTESMSKAPKKKKKEGKSGKNSDDSKKLFVSGEVFMNSIYLDKEGPSEKRKKKNKKQKTKARDSKKAKALKLAKKLKDSPNEMTSKERKRYLSVNTGKNPLLESDLIHNFNPRKTLNPKSISLKRGNSFKSNDIQKTDVFTYKFKRNSIKNDLKSVNKSKSKSRKKEQLYSNQEAKAMQPALYQRNQSQASSDNDDQQGLYKNLYSGRHEKKILEYNSNQSRGRAGVT